MKPPPFEYDAPETVDDALRLLSLHGEDAKVIAGGQSLVPLLNFRLARPDRLVDINQLAELGTIQAGHGTLRIGALVRQAALERSPGVADHAPLLLEAVKLVGHVQIRNRGTVGGSVAHADPAAELPVALATLDARFRVRGERGERELGAEELFVTHLTTSLAPDELLTEIEVPLARGRTGSAFVEFARRHGDFALGGAAVMVTIADDGSCERARIGLLAAAPTPMRAREAERWLAGRPLAEAVIGEASQRAVTGISPTGDIHGSTTYRHGLIQVMVQRGLTTAAQRAREVA